MNSFDLELTQRLAIIREQGLHRELRRLDSAQGPWIVLGGRAVLNFSSNDYLGLANDPVLKEAAIKAIEKYGTGSGASRLVCGSLAPHHELDEALAAYKGTEAALSFSSGYAAALGTIGALMDRLDVVILDKLVHACIVDAVRVSGAKLRVFPHNDLESLERLLGWATGRKRESELMPQNKAPRVLVVTESVFSMDGDCAPLREMVELKDRFGAWLMVDEAHATGLFGAHRRGLGEALGVSNRVEIQMGTLSKALGSSGGFICGSRTLIDYLVNRARSFIFSTAPVPAAAAAALAAVQFIQSDAGAERCAQLWQRVVQCKTGLAQLIGLPLGQTRSPASAACLGLAPGTGPGDTRGTLSAIMPLVIGDEARAMQAAAQLRREGVFLPAIRYPAVARGAARLRLTLTAAHSPADIEELHKALRTLDVGDASGPTGSAMPNRQAHG
jgi:8-amino-7-oxononanoate synthase